MALCSLSTGRMATPRRRAASTISAPAMTSTSLLASAIVLPASIAGEHGLEAGRARRRAEHDVDIRMRRRREQPVGPDRDEQRPASGAEPPVELLARRSVATPTSAGR